MKQHVGFSKQLWLVPVFTLLLLVAMGSSALAQDKLEDKAQIYRVAGVSKVETRSAIAATGALILEVGPNYVLVEATTKEVAAIVALGLSPEPIQQRSVLENFPPADSAYHDYSEMVAEIQQAAHDHPTIFSLINLGQSYEGRTIWAGKISDNVNIDEDEPEVLFVHQQHAREHLTVEQALYTLRILTDEYGVNQKITGLINTREIWLVFSANPDGSEHDIVVGGYADWRKNRQPNVASECIGTDLNRNWTYQWAELDDPCSLAYPGPTPFSSPETQVIRDFVDSRVIDGRQQIAVAIDFHTFSELVMWPYGYTYEDVPADMTQDDHDVFVAMGQYMAGTNGYTPQQGSDLYLSNGTLRDWLYGAHHVFVFTFEMYPKTFEEGGFYPPDEVIQAETERNRTAMLYLVEQADCPYRVIGKEAHYCPNLQPLTVGCRVAKGASQALGNGQQTAIAFDTQINDTTPGDDCWTPAEPSRLYARENGYYLAGGAITLKSAARSGKLVVIVRRGGGNWIQAQGAHMHTVDDSIYSVMAGMFHLNAGEYIEIVGYHTLGDGIKTYQAAGCEHCVNGWLMKIGD